MSKKSSIAPNSQRKSLRSYIHLKFCTSFHHKSESTNDILQLLCLLSFLRVCFKLRETRIRRNATARIVETMCYFNREIGLPDFGVASFGVAIILHLAKTICYSMHTVVRNSSFSKPLTLLQSFSSRITLKAE